MAPPLARGIVALAGTAAAIGAGVYASRRRRRAHAAEEVGRGGGNSNCSAEPHAEPAPEPEPSTEPAAEGWGPLPLLRARSDGPAVPDRPGTPLRLDQRLISPVVERAPGRQLPHQETALHRPVLGPNASTPDEVRWQLALTAICMLPLLACSGWGCGVVDKIFLLSAGCGIYGVCYALSRLRRAGLLLEWERRLQNTLLVGLAAGSILLAASTRGCPAGCGASGETLLCLFATSIICVLEWGRRKAGTQMVFSRQKQALAKVTARNRWRRKNRHFSQTRKIVDSLNTAEREYQQVRAYFLSLSRS